MSLYAEDKVRKKHDTALTILTRHPGPNLRVPQLCSAAVDAPEDVGRAASALNPTKSSTAICAPSRSPGAGRGHASLVTACGTGHSRSQPCWDILVGMDIG